MNNMILPGTYAGGGGWGRSHCRYTGCTLQTFVKHYEPFVILPLNVFVFRESLSSLSRMPVILLVYMGNCLLQI